ncbi:LysR family transcriptional regulator [Mangrovibacter phragmitis]|uniref:LysR family transcriptional regulator n=1 Tax=Mangrovibacter phragmitis TaxID=1691903 RepID=UPI003369CAAD
MAEADLNLLIALDVLLAEKSVAAAARRLGLSESAMSRTLGRLRQTTGDPLLVRAGRHMVLTPHGEQLLEAAPLAVAQARALLKPAASALNLATLERVFTLRTNDGFAQVFGPVLVAALAQSAPHAGLRFVAKPEKEDGPLREGLVDLEIGVLKNMGPEIYLQALFQDRFIGVVRAGHPLAQSTILTPQAYAAYGHIVVARHGTGRGPVDNKLSSLGLARHIVAVVPGLGAALSIARQSDLVALVPASFFLHQAQNSGTGSVPGLVGFELPVQTGAITVSQMWHPRQHNDPAHRWLRECLREVCTRQYAMLNAMAGVVVVNGQ